MATVIYNYFSDNYGFVDANNTEFESKYKSCSAKELKKVLKKLKCENGDLKEIKFVAKKLRCLLSKNNTDLQHADANMSDNIDHDSWVTLKKFSRKKQNHLQHLVLPNVQLTLLRHFPQLFQIKHSTFLAGFPSLIPQQHHLISPCPLDQISVICLKRCPYLRTYLTEIIHVSWSSGIVPSEWKKACTILIHKKDVTDNPANFRPITLESVPLKVFTSCLRNKIFAFLSENNYIEHDIQKGFTPNVAGTVEHTAHMAHIINTARIKQRSLVITLLDLKNAFGELHHNLIYKVLQYHHIPDPINELIRSLYTNFQTSIITEKFSTPFITVGRGVLQGDCLKPVFH